MPGFDGVFGEGLPSEKRVYMNQTRINENLGGVIAKSHKDSFFQRMQPGSQYSKEVFCEEPKINGRKVIVLQVMQMSDNWILAELLIV